VGESVFLDLIKGNFICSAVFKRTEGGRLNLFNEQLRFAEDRLFYLDLLGRGEGVFTHVNTMIIHRHGQNTSDTTDPRLRLAINQKVLNALMQVRQMDAIARHSQRLALVERCVDAALVDRIYYASFHGLRDTWSAIRLAWDAPEFKRSRRGLFLFRNLIRAILKSLKWASAPAG
jgi:hypothetical protein